MTDGPVAVGLLGDLVHLLHLSDDAGVPVSAGVRGDPVHVMMLMTCYS